MNQLVDKTMIVNDLQLCCNLRHFSVGFDADDALI